MIIPDDNPYKSFVIQTMDYYPFGAEFCDNSIKNFVQNHKYNGKEFDHMHGLNTYDYGARQYNPVTGRWDRMDPLCEKYYSISPYAYCANNPVMLIDPDGRKWEDPKEAERLQKNISKKIGSLESDINKAQSKIDSGKLKDKDIAKQQGKIDEYNERIANLKQSMNDINRLGDDQKNTYAFSQISGGKHQVRQGDDRIVYIETSSDAFSIHEITHIRQSLDAGGLKFKDGYLQNAGIGIGRKVAANMEIEAYKMQYSYNPSSFSYARTINGINYQSVGNIRDEKGGLVYPFINVIVKQEKIKNKIMNK